MKRFRNVKYSKNLFSPKKLKDWAKQVKYVDSFGCWACGSRGYLHSHHILPKSKFPKYVFEVWNGITLCKKCHLSKNGVHGTLTPRNSIVKDLRQLMQTGSMKLVKEFKQKSSAKKRTYKPYRGRIRKKYRFKRKIY